MNERILNLLSLCMQAKEKGHDCFFDYAPHCHMITLTFYAGGWKKGEVDEIGNVVADFSTKRVYFYCDGHIDEEEDEAKLSEAEAYLKELIA